MSPKSSGPVGLLWLGLSAQLAACVAGQERPSSRTSPVQQSPLSPPAPSNASPNSASPAGTTAPPAPGTPPPNQSPNNTPSSTPATSFFGTPRCANANVALCDSFEAPTIPNGTPNGTPNGSPNTLLWQILLDDSNSIVRLDTTRAARGKQSVYVHTPSTGYATAMIQNMTIFPRQPNTIYGRAFVYYQSTAPLPQAHWTLFSGSGLLAGQAANATPTLVRYGGQFSMLMANYFGSDQYQHAGVNVNGQWTQETQMPVNRWACFEWQFQGAGNTMHLWLDEQEVTKISIMQVGTECCPNEPWIMPTFSAMAIGWQTYQNDPTQQGYDMWLDEVALDTQRIGCTK